MSVSASDAVTSVFAFHQRGCRTSGATLSRQTQSPCRNLFANTGREFSLTQATRTHLSTTCTTTTLSAFGATKEELKSDDTFCDKHLVAGQRLILLLLLLPFFFFFFFFPLLSFPPDFSFCFVCVLVIIFVKCLKELLAKQQAMITFVLEGVRACMRKVCALVWT